MYYINKNGELSSITIEEVNNLIERNFDTICVLVNRKKTVLKDSLQNAEKVRAHIASQLMAIDKDIKGMKERLVNSERVELSSLEQLRAKLENQ